MACRPETQKDLRELMSQFKFKNCSHYVDKGEETALV